MVWILLFWDDVSCGENALKHTFPRLYSLEDNKEIDVALNLCKRTFGFHFGVYIGVV